MDLSEVFYLDQPASPLGIIIYPAYSEEEKQFYTFRDDGNGKVIRVGPIGIVELAFLAPNRLSDLDLSLPLADFLFQKIHVRGVHTYLDRIIDDIENLGASLGKILLLEKQSETLGNSLDRFVRTEIEYIYITIRSTYDLLNDIFVTIWDNVSFTDSKNRKNLPRKSFNNLVKKKTKLHEYGIPSTLIRYLESEEIFFNTIRDYRNGIMHHGKGPEVIFPVDSVLHFAPSTYLFHDFGKLWMDLPQQPNGLRPLLPFLSRLIRRVLDFLNRFPTAFEGEIQTGTPIAQGYFFWVRSPHAAEIMSNCYYLTP